PPRLYVFTLSLHDALPIFLHRLCSLEWLSRGALVHHAPGRVGRADSTVVAQQRQRKQQFLESVAMGGAARQQRRRLRVEHDEIRSEEHTSELQSQSNLVCR